MDFIITAFYLLLVCCLLIGATKKLKLWFGSISGLLVIIFLTGAQIIKYQTGFYNLSSSAWRSSGASETVGNWVVPGFIVLGVALLTLIEFRMIRKACQIRSSIKWLIVFLALFLAVAFIWLGYMLLFIVAFQYFPFAP